MKASIEVKSRKDAQMIRRALQDPEVYAFAVVMGALVSLPTDRARRRTLMYVFDHLGEQAEEKM